MGKVRNNNLTIRYGLYGTSVKQEQGTKDDVWMVGGLEVWQEIIRQNDKFKFLYLNKYSAMILDFMDLTNIINLYRPFGLYRLLDRSGRPCFYYLTKI